MTSNESQQGLETQIEIRGSEIEFQEADPEELEKLEMEVKEMAQKILQYRATLPDQLKDTLASVLAAHRPVFPEGSEPGTSGDPKPGQVPYDNGTFLEDGDHATSEKIQLLKAKLSDNASAMPIVLKRMQECISQIDKLDSKNRIIHPAFKGKRLTDQAYIP
ncbi:hypothetical protein FNV43_RR15258 [Rhamnella rubrinervis]|uniref:Uncharacterized protein n=1 Tax=Rhamnella rubrinervis TaxID=2594499 RepID=A0A8K0E8E8_9ROSA|nr:hypothetical protein FNV43_RR15258 [Rhamnella rubrinervis]